MRIIVVGGGIGGMCLAVALGKNTDHEVVVLERDTDPDSRAKDGFSVLIQNDFVEKGANGRDVLAELGLWEQCWELGDPLGTIFILNLNGSEIGQLQLPEDSGSRIHRGELRALLHRNIADSVKVEWGVKIVRYENKVVGDTKTAVVHSDEGREWEGDLVVCCDGANSKLRQQMFGDPTLSLGAVGLIGACPYFSKHKLLEEGGWMSSGQGIATYGGNMRSLGNEEVLHSWIFIYKEDPTTVLQPDYKPLGADPSSDNMKQQILKRAEATKLHAPLPEVIKATKPEDIHVWKSIDKEPQTRWHDGRVLLLGDAAHPMSPFAGAGANVALGDALYLAKLCKGTTPADIPQIFNTYETTRIPIGNKLVKRSRDQGEALLSSGAGHYMKVNMLFGVICAVTKAVRFFKKKDKNAAPPKKRGWQVINMQKSKQEQDVDHTNDNPAACGGSNGSSDPKDPPTKTNTEAETPVVTSTSSSKEEPEKVETTPTTPHVEQPEQNPDDSEEVPASPTQHEGTEPQTQESPQKEDGAEEQPGAEAPKEK